MFDLKVRLKDSKFCSTLQGRTICLMLVAVLSVVCAITSAAEKPRVFVLTDIENEPDDAMSMVRFLTYANQFDVEGLVATTSVHQQNQTAAWRIRVSIRCLNSPTGWKQLMSSAWK